MALRLMVIRFVVLAALCAHLSSVQAKETITWLVTHWPPYMMIEGEENGSGRFNKVLNLAMEKLTDYHHKTLRMNWSRFWHDVAKGEKICNIMSLKSPEKEKLAYQSEPYAFVLANSIILSKENYLALGSPRSYSIKKLLKDGRFTGMIEKNRSYSKPLDEILQLHSSGSNLNRRGERPESYLRMIVAGRLGYTIEYPIVVNYMGRADADLVEGLSSVPIEELPPITLNYTSCPKNDWGKKVISEWNRIFREMKRTEEFRAISEVGHTDPQELGLIRKHYESFLKQ